MIIREMTLADLESITPLQPSTWIDIRKHFMFCTQSACCYPAIACSGNEIVGVGSASIHGKVGWVGHIIVSEKCRRLGIGAKITSHLMNRIYQKNCQTISLLATADGEYLYRKLGFVDLARYHFFTGQCTRQENPPVPIQNAVQTDIESILKLDKEVTGEDRSWLLIPSIDHASVYKKGDSVLGYYFDQVGNGPIISLDEQVGALFLQMKHAKSEQLTCIPETNSTGISQALALGLEEKTTQNRMYHGEPVNWNPKCVYGRISGSFG